LRNVEDADLVESTLAGLASIKVLPASVAGDADRLARFQREAEVLAALNHPNIAGIYGLEKTSDFTALVMELVEGEDLSQRIARLRAPGASARQTGMPLDERCPSRSRSRRRWKPRTSWSRLVFSRSRAGIFDLYQKPANGAGAEALLLAAPESKAAWSWSPDGRSLLYTNVSPKMSNDVWVLPMAGDPKPLPFLNSTFYEGVGTFSPDGHWVAYQSDESGRREISVRPFPGPGGQWQVSTAGGKDPRWRPDGTALCYIAPDGHLMAAPIASSGTALQPGLPTALFQPRIALGGTPVIGFRQQYDVAPDGRFLINVNVDEGTAAPITVIMNWNPEAKK